MSAMEHHEAIRTQAAERYVLREMSLEEAEAFEQHFFDCGECAGDLRTYAAMGANLRAEERRRRVQPIRGSAPGRYPVWMPATLAATLALCAFLGWQQHTGAGGGAPQPIATFALHAVTRGEPNQVVVPAGVEQYAIYFDVVWAARPASYRVAVAEAATGVERSHFEVPAPSGGDPITLLFSRRSLPAGTYRLTLSDPEGRKLADLDFAVQLP